jgi:putative selenium metabolism hydrolase
MAGYLMAGAMIKEQSANNKLPFTLYVVGSVMEEDIDGYPLLHLIEKEGIRPDYVLLGEPTDLRVYRGQRGRMEMDISVFGKSAHGAHNQKGINAIYKMLAVVSEIEKLDQSLPVVEPLGKGSITVSQITSKAPSLCSVPDFARIHIDRRLTLKEDQEKAIGEQKSILKKTAVEGTIEVSQYSAQSWKGTMAEQEAFFPTWLLEEEHPLVRAGLKTAEMVSGKKSTSGMWSFSTNGVATAGRLGIPTIGFAPGKEELSHSDREELFLLDLLRATEFYSLFPFVLCDSL